jgi:2,3-bisphosphoglycerate-dependent phosphoglycerate mutase
MELLLIRHALPVRVEQTENADPGLEPEGRAQAEALAEWLRPEPLDALYVSPMRRALETVGPLEGMTGLGATIEGGLSEFDRGFDFYIPMEELKAENHPHWQVLSSGRWEDIPGNLFEFRDRVISTIDGIIARHPSSRVALVCHGGVINCYAASVLGIDAPLFFEPAYTSISRVLAASEGARSIVSLNETGHLRSR